MSDKSELRRLQDEEKRLLKEMKSQAAVIDGLNRECAKFQGIIRDLREQLAEPPKGDSTMEELARARREGYKQAVKDFSWSKSGIEFVGHPPGERLRDILRRLDAAG